MIIRRKPIGFDGLRKPRSLGMSLLRDSIQRMHNHTVQRVSPSDEPLSAEVSDFASDDFDYGDYADDGGDAAEFADYGDYADDGGLDAAIRRAEAPTPGQPGKTVRRAPRTTNNAKNTGNRPVQRSVHPQKPAARPSQQPAQSVQRAPAEPAGSPVFKRQQLTDGDTMPRDLSSILNLHRERSGGNVAPGENPPPASVDNLPPIPSFLADRGAKKAEAPVRRSASNPVQRSATPGSAVTSAQRTPATNEPAGFDADEPPPRPRRRAQITDVTPPKKGLPFGLDELPDTGDSPTLGTSPLGQPIQRDYAPASNTPAAPAANNDDFFAALERAAGDSHFDSESVPETENASASFEQASDAGQTMLDMDVRNLRAAPTAETRTAEPMIQREMDDDAAVYEDQPQTDAYQNAVQAAIQRAESSPTQDHDDSPDNPAADFDGGDDDGGNDDGGGSGGNGGGAPRNTPAPSSSVKPGSVQASRAVDTAPAPKNIVQPTRATGNPARPSADTVQPTRSNSQPQQPNNTPEPARGTTNTTIQRDFNQDTIENFDQDVPAASFPASYDSADDYQSALDAAISAAEAPTPAGEPPAPSPVRRTVRGNVQRAPEPAAEDEDTPIAQRAVQRDAQPDFEDEDAPIAQRTVQRDAQPDLEDEDGDEPIAQRMVQRTTRADVQRAAEDDLDIGMEDEDDAGDMGGVQRTPNFAAGNAPVQRDFAGDDAAEDTPAAYFPTGYDSADDYQSALDTAISAAEAPTPADTPAAPSSVRRAIRNNVRRAADPVLDEEEADPIAQRSIQRNTRGNVQRAPEDDFDIESGMEGGADSALDIPMAAPEDEEAGVQRTFDARSADNAPVQRDFAGDDAGNTSDYYPAGYDSADSYQSAISAAIQRAEGPTPAELPDTPVTPSRRPAQGKTARTAQRSAVQRTPDTSGTTAPGANRPARPARPSPSDVNSGDRGVFKTGAIMDAPPSLEDDALAVWTGQPYAGAVQRDFEDVGGEDIQDEIDGDGDGFGDVQRTPDWSAAEFNESAEFDDSGDDSSAPSGVESELLQMIGLSADTPIARPNVQRSPKAADSADSDSSSDDSAALNGLIQRSVGATRALDAQRAIAETNTDQSTDDQISPEKSEQIEKVAQAVYTRLRDRLKVERERLRGRRS